MQNAPELLGGKERIEEAFQTAVRANEITAREAVAWKSPTGKAGRFPLSLSENGEISAEHNADLAALAVLFHRF